MRSKEEMLSLILDFARKDKRIRAVWMNGSRTNPNAPADCFQDFDIVYAVTDMQSFIQYPEWVDYFGERIIMQTPEGCELFSPSLNGRYTYLMQFCDGNRIDLMLDPIEEAEKYLREDSLVTVLLDKDNRLPSLENSTDKDYWVKKPTERCFQDCCNEFWWVSTYVAKGLWRDEILYAMEHLNRVMNDMLILMLSWKVGIETDFSVSIGKCGKYLKSYLSEQQWNQLMNSYGCKTEKSVWTALFSACELFEQTTEFVSEQIGYYYTKKEFEQTKAYLKHVQQLNRDATEIY